MSVGVRRQSFKIDVNVNVNIESEAMPNQYSIRELSREFDVTTRTLRFYEEKGLLAPIRQGQSRVYSVADRARLILILRGKTLGLSLEQSAELISMYDPASNNKKQLELLVDKIGTRREQLQRQQQELAQMIQDLDAWEQRSLEAMLGRTRKGARSGALKDRRNAAAVTSSSGSGSAKSSNGELS